MWWAGALGAIDVWSVETVLFLQRWPHPLVDEAVVTLTQLGDPKLVFIYLAPLVYWCAPAGVRRSLGIELLLGLVLADVTNALLKCPARGHRPYWYDERVREFSVTCESGYGFPSGHMMVSSCVMYLLVSRVSPRWKRAATVASSLFLFILALSRMFVGAHFPLQVIVGTLCGLSLAFAIIHWRFEERLSTHFNTLYRSTINGRAYLLRAGMYGAAGSLIILGVAFAEYTFLSLFIDPMASFQLAREGCEATRLAAEAVARAGPADAATAAAAVEEQARSLRDKGPFMGICRDAGICLGGALALAFMQMYTLDDSRPPSPNRSSNSAAETVPLQTHRSVTPSTRVSLSTTSSLCDTLFRGLFGLAEAYVFRLLLVCVLDNSVAAVLEVAFPQVAVYVKNFVLFGTIAFNFLVIVPLLWKKIGQGASRDTIHVR